MARVQKLLVPFGLDAKLVRSRYAAMLPAQKKAFSAEFERFSQLQQLRIDAAARSARAAGVKTPESSELNIAAAKRAVATLKRLRPDVPSHFPPDGPGPVLQGPPYSASVPVDFSSNGAVDFKPWDQGPIAGTRAGWRCAQHLVGRGRHGQVSGGSFSTSAQGTLVCRRSAHL